MHRSELNPELTRTSKPPLPVRRVLGLAIAGSSLLFAVPSQGYAREVILIEENFEKSSVGARIDSNGTGQREEELSPSTGGSVASWGNDEVEIVKAWDRIALRFLDTEENGSRRLLFKTLPDAGKISSGELEVSLDFQIEGNAVSPGVGSFLRVTLTAASRGQFCRVDVTSPDLHLIITDGQEGDLIHTGLKREEDVTLKPNTVYNLKLLLALDKASYGIELTDKKTGGVVYKMADLEFLPIPELEQGIGSNLLNIIGGQGTAEMESLNPVTIDNILVKHK